MHSANVHTEIGLNVSEREEHAWDHQQSVHQSVQAQQNFQHAIPYLAKSTKKKDQCQRDKY